MPGKSEMPSVRFDREIKAWQTISGGRDDELEEFWEVDWSLVDYPRRSR